MSVLKRKDILAQKVQIMSKLGIIPLWCRTNQHSY
jgi:hypothetical protein